MKDTPRYVIYGLKDTSKGIFFLFIDLMLCNIRCPQNKYRGHSRWAVCERYLQRYLLSFYLSAMLYDVILGDPGGLAGAQRRLVSINGQQNENNVVSSDAKYIVLT